MLISFSFSNFSSFKETQTFSLLASEKNDDHQENLIEGKVLKSSLVYGANASGKSNFTNAFFAFREIVLDSTSSDDDESHISMIPPFLFDVDSHNLPIQFEIIFKENELTYRYGLSFNESEILEEWLYTKSTRETEVFFREKQSIIYKKSRFTELDHLIENGSLTIDKTIPVISVAALSSKPICKTIINFVKRIKTISGINEKGFKSITYSLFEEDEVFKNWALAILKNFNIHDLKIEHIQDDSSETRSKIKKLRVEVVKNTKDGFDTFPLAIESEGTRKVLYLLGPLYDSIKLNNLLIIDEFDSKFHTLLTKEILKIFHRFSKNESQLIAIVQDSCLMDSSILRPDQIWFIDKDNITNESQLYSLVEYKIKKKNHYGKDYLEGQYGAIPLFSDYSQIHELMALK
jgi:AAA15 family ATPase/GTPase